MQEILIRSMWEQRKLLTYWIKNDITSSDIEDYLLSKGIYNVVIYGMGDIGSMLCHVINKTHVKIEYAIDNSNQMTSEGVEVFALNTIKEVIDIDAVIVTPIFYYSDICRDMSSKVGNSVKILSLEDIIYGIITSKEN